MVSQLGVVFKCLDYFWHNVRVFAFRNRTIFEICFILIYSLEQIILIWMSFNAKTSEKLNYIISMFAVIVLLTFAIHKSLMDSRIKVLEVEIAKLNEEKIILESFAKEINSKYSELSNHSLSLSLNTTKLNKKL